MEFKGILIPIGGNEDKGKSENESYTLDFVHDGILSRVVRESGGKNSKIVVITTASSIPVEVGENYLSAFSLLGCTNVTVLDIRERLQSEEEHNISQVMEADCIMFSGGDQSRIVDFIGGTQMHKILLSRFKNERVVIAGTSAGAMAMSSKMVSGGSASEALVKGSVKMREGMCFMPGLIIDTHFVKRGRFGRLTEAVARYPKLLGVGLGEDTGMVIYNRNKFEIIGSGMVILFDPAKLTHNKFEILPVGTPMTMSNLIVHVLANGDSFAIDRKELKVLALESQFL